ncbi:J domain-containing protein [Hymenobacter baengnokdamensis]|uniref:J domain-containing protein n=1 Tax=Hymenobacter baengnokdamensis TaxID=2615203 RepID=UPI00177E2DD5|nr:J domain-containing protein [Hymenobacter baengnokdamensis]
MSQNHYQVLGVPPTAPSADIKRAYRRLATELHPDKHGGDRHYEEQFKAVAVAYGVLSDPDSRAQYDYQLQQATRRAEEQRRTTAQAAGSGPSVYKMPGTPAAGPPLRTRPPAGSRERHYQQRVPRQQVRFNKQDFWLVAGLVCLIFLFGISAKIVMDRVQANLYYADARTAFAKGQWLEAERQLDQALSFRDDHAEALRLRGQLRQDINHDLQAARADYQAALLADAGHALATPEAARLLYRLGRCEAGLHEPAAAELSYCRALTLDTTLAEAYLARGENRLLDLRQTRPALADLRHGRGQLTRAGRPVPLEYLQTEGAALAHLARYAEARATYKLALESQPEDGRTLFLLGRLAQQQGDSASGCEFFRRGAKAGYSYAVAAAAACQ